MNKIEDLKLQIDILNKEIQSELEKQQKDIILNLKWTEECDARLRINTMLAVGIPKYEIFLYNAPQYYGTIYLTGCKDLIYHYYCSNQPVISTSSDKSLIEFLQKVKFRKFEFDEKLYNLLSQIKTIMENK